MTNSHQSQKTAVAALSVTSNFVLIVAKLIIGLAIGSVSVLSEAIHSGVDLVAAIIALFAVKKSGEEADADHPYGHGKFENVSGVVEALLIFVAAIWIVVEAVKKLIHREPIEAVGWGIAVMAASSLVNFLVSHRLFQVGRKTDSAALIADAWHLRTDVYTSMGVLAGLGIILVGKRIWPTVDLSWVDPVAAILVACLILKAAFDLTREAGKDLLDVRLPVEEQEAIREIAMQASPRVREVHKMRTRKGGHIRYADMHVVVDPAMSLVDAHSLSHQIAAAVAHAYPATVTTIHVEPEKAR